jgi:amino-acid N-acetyltransferase
MTTPSPSIRAAAACDLESVTRLLASAELPTAGVADAFPGFVVAELAGELVGVAGLEIHGRDGVLRSVAVAPALRHRGLGVLLTERVLQDARRAGLRRVYLLTTTAADYFPRYGFRRIAREAASPDVQRSVEFREACPASAVAMELALE